MWWNSHVTRGMSIANYYKHSFMSLPPHLLLKCLMIVYRVCSTDNFLSPIFSPIFAMLSLRFWICNIMGLWGEFTIKNAALYLYILSWHFFVVFHQKMCVFIIFRPFQERCVIARACAHMRTKVFRPVINCTHKWIFWLHVFPT